MKTPDGVDSIPVPDGELYCDDCGSILEDDPVWMLDNDAVCGPCKDRYLVRSGQVRPPYQMEWVGTQQVGLLLDRDLLGLHGTPGDPREKAIEMLIRHAGPTLRGCFVLLADWVGEGEFTDGAICVSALFPTEEAMESVETSLLDLEDEDHDPDIVRVLHSDDLWRQEWKPALWIRADGLRVKIGSRGDWTPEAQALWLQSLRAGRPGT